ncbi:MAG: hypothetical protein AAF843_01315 [Bacteroidota bacterium]
MESSSKLTSQESLNIITGMIQTAKGNIKIHSFHFLLWGWVIALGNLGHYYLEVFTDYHSPFAVWLITIPAWVASFVYGFKQSKKETVKTYSDGLVMWVWLAFTFSILIIIFSGHFGALISPLILLTAGMATFMTGIILKFKPLIYGGSSFWIFASIAFHVSSSNSLLVSALAVMIGYLVPGYLLKNSKNV